MASTKLTPRQKMIGMMYLVLTAILALNISKDILDAFVIVNNGLQNSTQSLSEKTASQYAALDLAKAVDPGKALDLWNRAQVVKTSSTKMLDYIESLKKRLLSETEGVEGDTLTLAWADKKDDYNVPTYIMVGTSEDGSGGASRELKNKLDELRKTFETIVGPKDLKDVKITIDTRPPQKIVDNMNWEMNNFYNTPLAATITLLSKMQSDVKSSESNVVEYLYRKVNDDRIPFDTIAARVVAPSNYVMLGDEYKADVFLAAFSKTQIPDIATNDSSVIPVENGIGKYSRKAVKEGLNKYTGTIKVISPKGQPMLFPFESEYMVARPSLVVSPDNMNVFYVGLQNPVSISVPGVPSENITAAIDNGTLTKTGNGKYTAVVTKGGKVHVSVMATMENGEKKNMGSMEFRAKYLPAPEAVLGTIRVKGKMSKAEILAYGEVKARYDETFEFNAIPVVKSFSMSCIKNGLPVTKESSSGMLTSEMRNLISGLRSGQKIYFEDIKAVGADNVPRTLFMAITVQ